jgi:hypothetical protein
VSFWLRILAAVAPALIAVLLLPPKLAQTQASVDENGAAPAADETQRVFLPLLGYAADVSRTYTPLCRFGVNGSIDRVNISPLHVGWYMDYFGNMKASEVNGIEYLPMIRLKQVGDDYRYSIYGYRGIGNLIPTTEDELKELIAAHPNSEWFIGNEPDRRTYQDNLAPHIYAKAYHDLYYLIKGEDPTAKIIAGSIVQATPLRIQYLDMVLESYRQRYGEPMPVDIWAIHNFILNEYYIDGLCDDCWGANIPPGIDAERGLYVGVDDNDNFDLFRAQIMRFRQWLADRGYRGTPVYLSEYGVLMPPDYGSGYPPKRVNDYMNATFDYLLSTVDPVLGDPTDGYRLIQRFSWYSVHEHPPFNGYLFEPRIGQPVKFQTTPMGANFRSYAANLAEEVDFTPMHLAVTLAAGNNVTSTVSALVANSGNLAIPRTVTVRFYDGDPAAGGAQIGDDQEVALAGCGDDTTVQVQWPNAAPGRHHVFVSVDALRTVPETNEENNIASQEIFINQLFLPRVTN